VYGDECNEPTISVGYATGGGTAQPGADYDPRSGTAQLTIPVHGEATHTDAVPVRDDAEIEPADGPARVAFDGFPCSQSESAPSVRIPVFRAGSVAGSASISYSIAPSGTSSATAGADYTGASPWAVVFGSGERVKTIDFSLVNDNTAEPPETLTLSLTGTEVVSPSTTTFTILDK
jgi:hypothetical protein